MGLASNILHPVLIHATIVGWSDPCESTLSFLGLGVWLQFPAGRMLNDARSHLSILPHLSDFSCAGGHDCRARFQFAWRCLGRLVGSAYAVLKWRARAYPLRSDTGRQWRSILFPKCLMNAAKGTTLGENHRCSAATVKVPDAFPC